MKTFKEDCGSTGQVYRQQTGHISLHTSKVLVQKAAVVLLIDTILMHLDEAKTAGRAPFLDLKSAFNTFQPELILERMIQMSEAQIYPYVSDIADDVLNLFRFVSLLPPVCV